MPSPDTRPALLPVLSRARSSLSLVGASECATVHRCIASTPLHYDSYIAIFIISAARRCPRPRLTRHRFLPTRLLPFFLPPPSSLPSPLAFARREGLFFFGKSLPVDSRPLGANLEASRRVAPRRDHSMENSLEEIPPGVRSVVTRIVED